MFATEWKKKQINITNSLTYDKLDERIGDVNVMKSLYMHEYI